MKDLYYKVRNKFIISTYIPFYTKDRYFFKLSPDISLYLNETPLIIETTDYNINNISSKIIIYNDIIYLIDTNYNKVKNLEEMIKTYYLILSCDNNNNYNEIANEEIDILKNWDKEQMRLK
jgi:hypothetical protein